VLIGGRDLAEMNVGDLKAFRQSLGAVLQGTLPFTCGLLFSLTLFENVAEPLRVRQPRWNDDKITEVTLASLDSVGLLDRAKDLPASLSSGMAKRAAIARALALGPELVIIDDFDSGIDGVRLNLLCTMLRDYQLDSGATLFLSTHDMGVARALADHVAVSNDGRTVANGTADEVFASSDPTVQAFLATESTDFALPPREPAGTVRLTDQA
jgi:phospholipid/cholesterol/gamma-HCH transport system ATP-binding protein